MGTQVAGLPGLRGSDPNGGVKVVGLGTNHRLSLAQNPVLLAGQIAILIASCNRDVARLRKRRQVAALVGLEVAQRPHSVHYTIISRNPTTRTPPLGSDPRKPLESLLRSAFFGRYRPPHHRRTPKLLGTWKRKEFNTFLVKFDPNICS